MLNEVFLVLEQNTGTSAHSHGAKIASTTIIKEKCCQDTPYLLTCQQGSSLVFPLGNLTHCGKTFPEHCEAIQSSKKSASWVGGNSRGNTNAVWRVKWAVLYNMDANLEFIEALFNLTCLISCFHQRELEERNSTSIFARLVKQTVLSLSCCHFWLKAMKMWIT